MNKNNLLILFGGIAVGAVAAALLVKGMRYDLGYGTMGMMNVRQSGSMMNGNIDRSFIEQMIPHHEDAITMSNIALQKAEHPEIKQLAQNIINSQSAEIAQMRLWYKQWFGQDVSKVSGSSGQGMGAGMMRGGMMGTQVDTAKLESASPFDKAFIEQMIPHHQMAVMMAQMLKASSSRPEMQKLAGNIITAQTKEINDMRQWYSQWYK